MPHPKRRLILFVIIAASSMDMLDGTVVNVAAPAIHSGLHTSSTALQWIVGGYALALAVGMLIGGRLGDLFGRRNLFLIGVGGFTAASAVCGLATSAGVLIVARLAQGFAGAMMMPQTLALLRAVFAEDEMPRVFAVFAPVMGLTMMIGPILGGALIALHLAGEPWRPVFLVNVPVGIASAVAAARLLPRGSTRFAERLDLRGAMIAALAVLALLYPLIEGRELGWPAWTYVSIAIGLGLLAAFASHLRREKRAGRDPLIEPSIFTRRGYSAGSLVLMLYFGGIVGTMLAITLYLQSGEGYSAIHAGLTVAPFALGAAITAPIAGVCSSRIGGRTLIQLGSGLSLLGFAALAVVLGSVAHVSGLGMLGPLLVVGLGMGSFVVPAFDTILLAVTEPEVGSASATLNAFEQLAGAIGVAVLGTIFFATLHHSGFATALRETIWSEVAVLGLAIALSPLLPGRIRRSAATAPAAA